jgi:hypothetical protein
MVCVDLVGSSTIRTSPKTYSLLALTMIDPAIITDLIKIIEDIQTNQKHPSRICDKIWLVRFLWPEFIMFNNANVGRFKREYKQICDNYGIKDKSTTSHNILSTSKCNDWASTQSFVLSIIFSDHLAWKIIMKVKKKTMNLLFSSIL